MPPETQTQSYFALEGFLPTWLLVALGLALFAGIGWLARVDRRAVDRPWPTRLFPALRAVAALILLWILAGPTRVTLTQQFKPKTLAFFVDRSASMGLVDINDGSGNVARWSAAQSEIRRSPVAEFDAAVAALRVQENLLRRFARIPDTTASPADLQSARAILQKAADAVPRLGARLIEASSRAALDAAWQRATRETAESLSSDVAPLLASKAAEFSRGKTLAALDRAAWLSDVSRRLAEAAHRLEQLGDRLAVATDQSSRPNSGSTAPSSDSRLTRAERVDAVLAGAETHRLQELRKTVRIQRFEFGDRVVPQGSTAFQTRLNPAANPPSNLSASTQLGAPLEQMALDAAAQPIAATFLFTDGGHNAGRDPREIAPSLSGTPLFIFPIGNTKMQRDVILHHTHAPKAVFQGDQVVVDSMVTAYDCAKETLQAELLEGDRVVDRQTLSVSSEVFDTRVQLRWKAARLGKQSLTFRIAPVGDERSQDNNLAKTDVLVMEDKIRVLVADNFPRWETRYLINLFKRDSRVVFEQLLFEPQRTAGDGSRRTFPATLQEWSQFRVVILGDLLPSQLTAADQKNLSDYVSEAGGNLILVAGKDAMPAAYVDQALGKLLPVLPGNRPLTTETPYYLQLSDEGSMSLATQIAESPVVSERLWREMSERLPIYSLSEFSRPKPTSRALIWATANSREARPRDGDARSFLSWQYVGAGRVVYLAAPVSYQLRYRQGDTFHHRFWGQLLRWTVARDLGEGSQTLRITTDKSRYETGERVEAWVRLRHLDGRAPSGAALVLTASQDGRVLQEIPAREDKERPGTYLGAFLDLPVGPVQLTVSGEIVKNLMAEEKLVKPVEATLHMDPGGSTELRQPLCNLSLLREIADGAAGTLLPPAGLQAALEQLDLAPQVTELTSKMPLWNRWDLFWVFMICLSLEWAGRKYVGLS